MTKIIALTIGALLSAIVSGEERKMEWGNSDTRMIAPAQIPYLQERVREGYFERIREELFPDCDKMRIEVDDKVRLCTEGAPTEESFCYANVCLIYSMLVGEHGDASFVESFEPEVKKRFKRGIKMLLSKLGEGMKPYKSICMTCGDKESLRYDFYEAYDVSRGEKQTKELYPLFILLTHACGEFTSYALYVMAGRFSLDSPYYKGVAFSYPIDREHVKKAEDMIQAVEEQEQPESKRKSLVEDIYHMHLCVRSLRMMTTEHGEPDINILFGEKKTIPKILLPLWEGKYYPL